jgi:hypothetical protein
VPLIFVARDVIGAAVVFLIISDSLQKRERDHCREQFVYAGSLLIIVGEVLNI